MSVLATSANAPAQLRKCGTVIHLAARAHVLNEGSASILEVYRTVNRDMTLQLAKAAIGGRRPSIRFCQLDSRQRKLEHASFQLSVIHLDRTNRIRFRSTRRKLVYGRSRKRQGSKS